MCYYIEYVPRHSGAPPADALPLSDTVRARTALMARHAANAVRLMIAEPRSFEHYPTKGGYRLAENCLGHARILLDTCSTDTLSLLDIIWDRTAFMSSGAPNAMRLMIAKPHGLKYHSAKGGHRFTEYGFSHTRVHASTYSTNTTPLLDTGRARPTGMAKHALGAMRHLIPKPFRLQDSAAKFADPFLKCVPSALTFEVHSYQPPAIECPDPRCATLQRCHGARCA
jgi:hypothetical protein